MTFQKILFFILFITNILSAQIKGRIVDAKSQQPLSGASIYFAKSKAGATSSADGYFSIPGIKKNLKNDTLIVSFMGYDTYHRAINDLPDPLIIYLNPVALELKQSIQVTAERVDLSRQEIPHLQRTLSFREIEEYGSPEISNIFKKEASVRVQGNDLDGRAIQIRGSNANEVNVYLDGILLNGLSPNHIADISLIPTEMIGKMQIIKGANLPLLGHDAFGGVINIFSRQTNKPEIILKGKDGSFNSHIYSASFNFSLFSCLRFSYFGQYQEFKPQIEFFPGEQFSGKTTNSRIHVFKRNHFFDLDFLTSLGQFRSKIFNYMLNYNKPQWNDERNTWLYSLQWIGKKHLNFAVSQMDFKENINRYSIATTKYLSDYRGSNLNIKLQKRFMIKKGSLQSSAEYFHEHLSSQSILQDSIGKRPYYKAELYDNRLSLGSVFSFRDQVKDSLAGLSWRTFVGVRGDLTASGYRNLSDFFGVRLNWHRGNRLIVPYFNYGKNVKYPTLAEKAYIHDLITITINDTSRWLLKPEFNNSYELGSRFRWEFASGVVPSVEIHSSLFLSTTYNKIIRQPLGRVFYQSQTGRNSTKGMEASIQFDHLFSSFKLSASGMIMNIDNPLLYAFKPEHNYNMELTYHLANIFYINLLGFWEGKSYAWYFDNAGDLQTQQVKAHWDGDASAGLRFHFSGIKFHLQASAFNLFDNSGFDYYYLYKRNFQLSLSIRF